MKSRNRAHQSSPDEANGSARPGVDRSGVDGSAVDDKVLTVPPAKPVEIEFYFPADLASLAMVRRRVEQVARLTATMGAEDLDKLRLVLTEVVANAVTAHAEQSTPEALRLRCCLSPDRVEVSVLDQGGGFLATTGSHPVIDTSLPDVSAPEVQKREGGFGLGIIDAFADEAEFSPVDGGTSVRFVIYPSGDSEPETP
ncbi:MAG: ATP-binding protein [Candidatus Microthrix sp.]|nr:ATP-binding protein [Candidatus Microthrix sp.]MBK9559162.1 ATP-binding protein [Candidatus Microthrix sp.]